MFIFRKIWRALFSCNNRFEIRHFVLLATKCELTPNNFGCFRQYVKELVIQVEPKKQCL